MILLRAVFKLIEEATPLMKSAICVVIICGKIFTSKQMNNYASMANSATLGEI